jgi:hypothetical protein
MAEAALAEEGGAPWATVNRGLHGEVRRLPKYVGSPSPARRIRIGCRRRRAEYKDEIVRRWWREDEAYRGEIAGLLAGAARSAPDPEAAFALWLTWAETPEERAYVEDLISRDRRYFHTGIGARQVKRS